MSMKNIKLLTKKEISERYDIPDFNDQEREYYFSLSTDEVKLLNNFTTVKTQVYFILALGYFKAKQLFFKIRFEVLQDDVKYVFRRYLKGVCPASGTISFEKRKEQQQIILSYLNYSSCEQSEVDVMNQFLRVVRSHSKPRSAVREIMQYCDSNNILLPSYRKLQDMYSEAHSSFIESVKDFFDSIPEDIATELNSLLDDGAGHTSKLNTFKYEQQNFNLTELKSQIEKVTDLTNLYHFFKTNLKQLNLSQNAISYYAQQIDQYPISRIRKMSKVQQLLHVSCFVYRRYQELVESLIETFLYRMRDIRESVSVLANAELVEHLSKVKEDFPGLADFFRWFPSQESTSTPKEDIYRQAYEMVSREQFKTFADFFNGDGFDKTACRWKHIQETSRMVSMHLRPIIMAVDFDHYKSDHLTLELLKIIKQHYSSGKTPAQLKIADNLGLSISANMAKYLKAEINDTYLNPYRFEFFVYEKLFHQINKGFAFCNDSVSYKDIDKDLVPEKLVAQADEISSKLGYSKLPNYCDSHLDNMADELNTTWNRVTMKFNNGAIPGVKLSTDASGKVTWTLEYEASEEFEDGFFDDADKIDISKVFSFIDSIANALDNLEHTKGRYIKQIKPDKISIIACILSEAFGFGIQKMADISDLNFNTLRTTHENFIRLDSVKSINTIVSDYINELPIFKAWDLLDEKTLADIDGQKESTKKNTIHSRYSKKYLGKGMGLSILSLMVNYISVNAKNIGLNQYEGHHLFDMVYDNQSSIIIDAVTGDNHSTNKLNYVAMDLIDVDFVPNIKNLKKEAENLCSILDPEEYANGLLKPANKINIDLIKEQKEGITRVLLSLLLQENTQSVIIKKLNSHDRYARLRKALYEYNNLLKSKHILNMIEDIQLRKAVKTARNRTESYHQLQKIIRNMYQGVYRTAKTSSMAVCTQSVSLVSNMIVAYNAIILNKIYEKMIKDGAPSEKIETFLRISPMSWVHIGLTGKYTFGNDETHNLEDTIASLKKPLAKLGIISNLEVA